MWPVANTKSTVIAASHSNCLLDLIKIILIWLAGRCYFPPCQAVVLCLLVRACVSAFLCVSVSCLKHETTAAMKFRCCELCVQLSCLFMCPALLLQLCHGIKNAEWRLIRKIRILADDKIWNFETCMWGLLVSCWFSLSFIYLCNHCATGALTTTWAAPTSSSIQPLSAWEESSTATWDRPIRWASWSTAQPPTALRLASLLFHNAVLVAAVLVCQKAFRVVFQM